MTPAAQVSDGTGGPWHWSMSLQRRDRLWTRCECARVGLVPTARDRRGGPVSRTPPQPRQSQRAVAHCMRGSTQAFANCNQVAQSMLHLQVVRRAPVPAHWTRHVHLFIAPIEMGGAEEAEAILHMFIAPMGMVGAEETEAHHLG
jgi:hypothetical protein